MNETSVMNEWDYSYEWIRLQLWMNKTSAKDEWDYSYEWMRLQLWMNETSAMNKWNYSYEWMFNTSYKWDWRMYLYEKDCRGLYHHASPVYRIRS